MSELIVRGDSLNYYSQFFDFECGFGVGSHSLELNWNVDSIPF